MMETVNRCSSPWFSAKSINFTSFCHNISIALSADSHESLCQNFTTSYVRDSVAFSYIELFCFPFHMYRYGK